MIPEEILKTITYSTHRERPTGGQTCGIPNYGCKLTSKEMGFEVSTDAFRTQMGNREFCMSVFELFLSEIKAI